MSKFTYADFNHVFTYGQSNAQGFNQGQGAPISTVQPYHNVTFEPFTMRLHTQDGTEIPDATSTVGMVTTDYAASGLRAPWYLHLMAHLVGGAGTFWGPDGKKSSVWDYEDYLTKLTTLDFRPLTEAFEPVGAVEHSESVVTSLCSELTKLNGQRYVGSCCGNGSMKINHLSAKIDAVIPDGYAYDNTVELAGIEPTLTGYCTGAFAALLAQVKRAKEIVEGRGQTYKVAAICWIQGESNNGGVNADGYAEKLIDLVDALNICIKAITGQIDDVNVFCEFITYSRIETGHYQIDDEFLQAADADPRIHMVMPRYQLNTNVHHSPVSTITRGHLYAECIYKVLNGHTWEPLRPTSHGIVGNDIYLKFNVINPPLQFSLPKPSVPSSLTESAFASIIANQGFEVKDSGDGDIITSVEVSGHDTIKLTCSADPTGGEVHYGQIGEVGGDTGTRLRGSLCDSNIRRTLTLDSEVNSYESRNFSILFRYQL
tara:strand:+ start:111207 stop:112664 length:1458 start_codon:yes stop_codon:yes gene_type:complete